MAESKKKKSRSKSRKPTTKAVKPTNPETVEDHNTAVEPEVLEVDFSQPAEETATDKVDYGITKRTSSGPTSDSKLSATLSQAGSMATQTLRRPSFWLWLGGIAVIVFLLLVIWWQWQRSYVAVVNGQYVPTSALVRNSVINSGSSVLPNLTQQYLIEQEAQNLGITIDQDVIDAELQSVVDESGGQGSYEDALSRYGIPESYIVSQIRTRQLLVEMVKDKINITDEEVLQYYEDNRASIDPEGTRGFDNIKDLVRTEMTEQRQETEFANLLQSLQEKSQISTHPEHANLTFGHFFQKEIASIPGDIAHLFRTLTGQN